jgi:predicted dehydrogenase
VRVGFLGVGDRGRRLLGAALELETPGKPVRPVVVALCDASQRNLKRGLEMVADARSSDRVRVPGAIGGPAPGGNEGLRPRGFTEYKALLDEKDLDAVFIATPVHLHASQTMAALAAGKHVYCEKPLATSVGECREVLLAARAASRSGLRFQVGLQRRYSPRYRESLRLIHGGEAGRVLFVRAQWHAAGNPPKDKPWLFQREKSGDMVLEQGCHQFDIFNWVFQSAPLRACGLGGTSRYAGEPAGRDTLDHYGAILEYPGDAKVLLSHLTFALPDRRFSGIYELAFAEKMGVDLGGAAWWKDSGETRQLLAGSQGVSDTNLAVEAFLESVATGAEPIASAEVGYRATLAALLCRKAIESRRTVEWKEIEPA